MKTFKILIISIILLSASTALAANLSFDLADNNIRQNSLVEVEVEMDTAAQIINAVEGEIKYDEKLLELIQVNTGGSFVSIWVEKPRIVSSGLIRFSGVVPGGINTKNSELFTLVFKVKSTGQGSLMLDNVNFYLSDGEGTKISARSLLKNIYISKGSGEKAELKINDDIVPEKFDVLRAKDSTLYGNKWFVAFSTLDKETGVSYYRVCEFWKCREAESPYELHNQSPFYYITVEAYDLNNNKRTSTIISPYFLVGLFILAIIYILYRRLKLKAV